MRKKLMINRFNKGEFKMKVFNKYLVIALLLSLIFSVSAVAAQEDMTFEQSDIDNVYDETLTVSSDDTQEIKAVEDDNSADNAEDNDELLGSSDDNQLAAGEGTFSEVRNKIEQAGNGSTIYLDGKTYLGDGNKIEIKKDITIIGGTESNPEQYATLDARKLSSIIQTYNRTNIVLKYIKFINGKSTSSGAAINAQSNLTIDNCQFINNSAQDGGALHLVGHIYHVIRHNDPTWKSYNETYYYDEWYHEYEVYNYYEPEWGYSYYYPYGSSYETYYYDDYSSDLYIGETFKYSISNCYFAGNNATRNGGAINMAYGNITPTIINCIFENNVAKDGGAIYSPRNILLNDSSFKNNSATNEGGAIYLANIASHYFSHGYYSYRYKYSGILNNCDFTDNSATKNGGAIRGYFDKMYYSKFTSNKADNGGAVHGSGTIYYSNFTKNTANNTGGATYSVSLENCNLINNTASRGGAGYGGTIKYCTFTDNKATDGGALLSSSVSYSVFTSNIADNGGALYSGSASYSNFTSNKADNGGAIYGSSANYCNFNSNEADHGGAVYCTGSHVQNSNFTNNKASDSSTGIYISTINSFNNIKRNKFSSDKTEILIKTIYDYNGLDIRIMNNETYTICEGEIKLYAMVTNSEGVKFSFEEFIFVVGAHEVKTNVIDNYAEVMFNATPRDNNTVISVKTTSSTTAKISPSKLYVYPYVVYIEFDDSHGYLGDIISVPVYVHDSTGHPVKGNIYVNYNSYHDPVALNNGHANITLSLPNTKRTLDLIIEYDGVTEIRKVNVLDPNEPAAVIIEMPVNETGYVGKTVTVPINIHDGLGTQLEGDIHVAYNGHEETITLTDGKADIQIALPIYETYFDLGISYWGYNAICRIFVEDPTVESVAQITLPKNKTGNAGETIKIPVKIVDENGDPLTGDIHISYYGRETTQSLNSNGEVEISVVLPDYETSFELIVNFNGNIKSCLVETVSPTNHTVVVIDINDTYTGLMGKTLTVPVKVSDDKGNALDGIIHVSYNGHDRTVTLVDGKANVEIELPSAETSFELLVSYQQHVATSLINVVYQGAHISAVIDLPANRTEEINKAIIIPVTVTDSEGNPLEGDISIYYAGKELTRTLDNGTYSITIAPIENPTSFELTVAYHADMAHCMVNIIDPNPAPAVDAIITMPESESGHVNHEIVVPVSVADSKGNPLEGNIFIYYNGNIRSETLHNGKASIVMTLPSEATSYNLTVIYKGISKECLITVLNESEAGETNDTTIVIDMKDEYIAHTGETLEIAVGIHDGKGNALEGSVTLSYLSHVVPWQIVDGVAKILIGIPVNPADFKLGISYEGINKVANIKVFDSNNPMGDISDVATNGTGSVVIPMPEDATGDVNVTIGGKIYPGKIVNGKIIVNITDLPNGTYSATVSYSGDGNYSASEKIITIVIKDSTVVDPNSPLANVTDAKANGDGSVVIPFPSDATGDVIVTIDGKNYTGRIVNGQLVLDITDLPAGNYTSIVYYLGDSNYNSTIKTIVIIKDANSTSPTNPMGDTTQSESDNGTVTIPFPKDATGEVMVEIDGKYYTGRIVNGEVVLDVGNLPMGNYSANVHYFGDGKYGSSSRTIMFVIKETINNNNNQNTPAKQPAAQSKKATKITAKKKTFKKALKVKKYSITLKSGKTPLKKVQVTIKIGKKTYKAKTNNKGKATFKIKKLTKKGKYKAVVKFKGNKNYKATSKKVKITVK